MTFAEFISVVSDHWVLAILVVLSLVWVIGAVILMVLSRSVSMAAALWPLLLLFWRGAQ